MLGVVVVALLGTLDALAAATLGSVSVQRQALDIARMAHGHHADMAGHEFAEFEVFGLVALDRGLALVAEALDQADGVGAHDGENARAVGEDRLKRIDFSQKRGQFARELLDLKANELDEAQCTDGIGLHAREVHAALAGFVQRFGAIAQPGGNDLDARISRRNTEGALHQPLDRFLTGAAGADELDDFVDIAHRVDQAFELVGGLARLAQLELGAAADDIATVVDIALDQLAQRKRARLVIDQRDVLDRVTRLQRSELVQLLLDDARVGALLEDNLDAGARVAARVIAHGEDVLDAIFFRSLDDLLDERALRDLIGDLVDDDRVASADFLVANSAAQHDASATRGVGLHDAAPTHDDSTSWEIRPGHDLHQSLDADQRIVDGGNDCRADLGEIVRRHGARHADGDAARAVDEQVGQLARQHARLHEPLVVVRLEVDGFLVEILHHRHRRRGHARFGVTHRCRRIALDGAEIALLIDQQVARLPILPEVDQRRVDDAFAVGVVVTAGVAADLRALDLLAAGRELEVVHGHEDAPLRGLEPIAHIGQCTIHDRAHRVSQVALVELAVDLEIDDAIVRDRWQGSWINWLRAISHRKTCPFGTLARERGL